MVMSSGRRCRWSPKRYAVGWWGGGVMGPWVAVIGAQQNRLHMSCSQRTHGPPKDSNRPLDIELKGTKETRAALE
jgi:hypothetical protein